MTASGSCETSFKYLLLRALRKTDFRIAKPLKIDVTGLCLRL
jgi:hypothetical protein